MRPRGCEAGMGGECIDLGDGEPSDIIGLEVDRTAEAAIDLDDTVASFSAYGERVDACAPGVDIYGPMPEGRYAWWSGCSMATGVATGAASLVHAIQPEEPEDANEALLDTAVDIDPDNPGAEGLLGEGRIDVLEAALEALED